MQGKRQMIDNKRKYHRSWRSVLPTLIIFFFYISISIIFYCAYLMAVNSTKPFPELLRPLVYIVQLQMLLLVGFSAFAGLFLLTISIGRVLFGYLIISDNGIVYRKWPFPIKTFSWSDVEKISHSSIFRRRYDYLLIRKTKPGFAIKTSIGTLGSPRYHTIPLHEIKGWRDGDLVNDLRSHMPALFDKNEE